MFLHTVHAKITQSKYYPKKKLPKTYYLKPLWIGSVPGRVKRKVLQIRKSPGNYLQQHVVELGSRPYILIGKVFLNGVPKCTS